MLVLYGFGKNKTKKYILFEYKYRYNCNILENCYVEILPYYYMG